MLAYWNLANYAAFMSSKRAKIVERCIFVLIWLFLSDRVVITSKNTTLD